VAAPESTYDPSTNVGKVRLYIQDTEVSNAKFNDAEINIFITEAGSGKLRAAAGLALLTWAAGLAREDESVSVGAWKGDRLILQWTTLRWRRSQRHIGALPR